MLQILWQESYSLFLDPQKRLFIGYLLSGWLIAGCWLIVYKQSKLTHVIQTLFSGQVWLSTSARTDYGLLIINRIIMALISPLLLSQLWVATVFFEYLHHGLSPQAGIHWPGWAVMGLFTTVLFLLDDASRYLLHRWMHEWRVLWHFHRIHHSATQLTPLTIFRTHPVEGVLYSLRSTLIQGICIGVFVFIFGGQVDLLSIFGVHIFLFLFNALGANLRHSHVPLPYPKACEKWLISPAQHQIHHSSAPKHFNRNYGVCLALWDRWGGTFHYSEADQRQTFGTSLAKGENPHSLWQCYYRPLIGSFKVLSLFFQKKTKALVRIVQR